eukprot:5672766-Pleurochrysis_carterae.AAC.1
MQAEHETMAGLPGEVISGYGECPGGNECLRGAWAVQPSPVLAVHMVGQRSKCALPLEEKGDHGQRGPDRTHAFGAERA